MAKKFYKLEDISNFTGINNFFAATGTPTFVENATQISLWTEDNFEDIFDKQSGKSLYVKETADPWGAFKNKYTQWLARNSSFIANELYALLSKYNPIYNYDRHEVYSGSDTALKTPTDWVQTKTETPDNWKETTTQTPTNWKSTETQTPTNWKSTETQTPTNWEEETVKSFDQYHETETQTPTDWEEETVKSFDQYHETETQTPTNWEKTDTQTPTQWTNTKTDAYTNYTETDTQTPTNWVKTTQTAGASGSNGESTQNQIIPYNGDDFANVSKTTTQRSQNVTETQGGTYQDQKTITGSKSLTETQSGTYQVTSEQSGTYETDRTKTGTETDTKTQSGTYETDRTKTGTETDTKTQSGTYETETEQSGTYQTETQQTGTYQTEISTTGSRTETIEQEGTFEDKTTYGKKVDITGNIGVVSTVDMINQILALYDTDFVDRWITRFIDSCCAYV